MKKIYFFNSILACFLFVNGQAQTLTATGSNPTVGETFNFVTTAGFSPGGSGSGQTWNFSTLSGTNGSSSAVTVGSTPNGSNFPSANLAFNHGGGTYSYHNTNSSAYQAYGYDANGTIILYSNPEDQLHFPFSLSNTYNDFWQGSFVSGGYTFYREGTTTVTADGTGTLITPSGTITNVVRVHFVQNYTDSTFITAPYVITYNNDQYIWYKDGTHFALASTYTLTNSVSGTTTGGTYLITTVGVEENSLLSNSLEVFPNPAIDNVGIKFSNEGSSTVDVSLINIAGQLVYSQQLSNISIGENLNYIDVKDIEKGTYFVKLQSGSAIAVRKIVIQ